MTAIAGCVGDWPVDRARLLVKSLLGDLQAFGNHGNRTLEIRNAVLAIRQSSVVQQDGASPPCVSAGAACVADARIDNRPELIARWGLNSSITDTELILGAWHRERTPFTPLLGDFAYALAHPDGRTVHLVRSASGERPLFFSLIDGATQFATMPWALIAAPDLWHGWDEGALAAMLLRLDPPSPRSYYKDIQKVLPGEAVTIVDGIIKDRKYWDPQSAVKPYDRFDDAVNAYRNTLDSSVAVRLRRSSGGVAAQLSSGWDSSAVAATAARALSRQGSALIAITAAHATAFHAPSDARQIFDESDLARVTADLHAMEHVIVRPERSVLAMLRSHVRRYQDPDRNIVNSSWWDATFEAARDRGASVMLTGEFGNLTFNRGDRTSFGVLAKSRAWRHWLREARQAASVGELRWTGILFHSFQHLLPPALSEHLLRLRLGTIDDSSACFVAPDLAHVAREQARRPKGSQLSPEEDIIATIRSLDRGTLRKGDLAAFGIDTRDPTADERAIQFGLGLLPEQMLDNGELRPVARAALADRLPPAILANQRRGAQGADWFHAIHRGEAAELVEEIGANASVRSILDMPKLKRVIDDWPDHDDGSLAAAQLYSQRMPAALATGLFIIEAEKIAGKGASVSS